MNARIGLCTTGFLAVMALTGQSCGGGGGKPLTIADFCSQKADKECQVTTKCVTTAADCKTQRVAACMEFAQTADTDVRDFRPENVQACIDKTNSVYAKSTITPTGMADLDDTCNYVFQGKVEKLAACTTKYDCKDRIICDKGLCAEKVTKGTDALCADPGAVCSKGQYCAMSGAVLKCINKAALMADCSDEVPCVEEARCSNAKCAPFVMAGQACASNADCPTTAPYCDPYAGKKCDPGLAFAAGSPSCNAYGGNNPTTGAAGTGGGTAGTGGGAAGTGGGAAGTGGGSDAAAGTVGGDAASAE